MVGTIGGGGEIVACPPVVTSVTDVEQLAGKLRTELITVFQSMSCWLIAVLIGPVAAMVPIAYMLVDAIPNVIKGQ